MPITKSPNEKNCAKGHLWPRNQDILALPAWVSWWIMGDLVLLSSMISVQLPFLALVNPLSLTFGESHIYMQFRNGFANKCHPHSQKADLHNTWEDKGPSCYFYLPNFASLLSKGEMQNYVVWSTNFQAKVKLVSQLPGASGCPSNLDFCSG